jgi:flagellar biosynthesis protein FlhF
VVIKKYIAATEQQAVAMAKEELGNQAVIMNVKEKSARGIFRFFRKASVEITAAVDEMTQEHETENSHIPDFSKLQEAIEKQDFSPAPDSKMAQQEAQKEAMLRKKDIIAEEELLQKGASGEQQNIERRLNSLQDLLEKQLSGQLEEENIEETDGHGESERLKNYIDLIRDQLVENEVDPKYVEQLIEDAGLKKVKDASIDHVLAAVYQKIILKLGQSHLIDIHTKKTKFIYFIGPTGVGKTTTIAKIASTLKLSRRVKVALITADTYRIAAVEQLKTYANILGIPLSVIYTAEEMTQKQQEMEEFDLVLVDTAGRSHNNPQQKSDIENLLKAVPDVQRDVYLVLSATTKYKDLKNIVQSYSALTKYNLVFTKLDETDSVGNILNIRMLTNAPLSYMTWGQNVPDDIGKIDAQKIAKQLLGGNS